MKYIKQYIYGIAGLLLMSGALSCTKTFDAKLPLQTGFETTSIIQVYNGIVNSARTFVSVDGKNVNGSSLTLGSVFPTSGTGFSVQSGTRPLLIRDTAGVTTQIPLPFTLSLTPGKKFTVFLYDTITSPKQKTVETNIIVPDDTTARLRFANFVYSKVAVPGIDIYSYLRKANIFTNLQVTDVTDFIPYASDLTDTISVRITGTTTDLMNITPPTPPPGNVLVPIRSIFTLASKRSYTFVFRGSYATILTNSLQVRGLSLFSTY